MIHERPTFQTILTRVAPANARQLMSRARLANRLAKSLHGTSRNKAYRVKTDALLALTRRFPGSVHVTNDSRLPRFVVVRFTAARFGLHLPENQIKSEPRSA